MVELEFSIDFGKVVYCGTVNKDHRGTVKYGDLVGTWTDGGPYASRWLGLARVVLPRVERQSVAECILLNAWRQIRKFHLAAW